jgi:hypothetical protein
VLGFLFRMSSYGATHFTIPVKCDHSATTPTAKGGHVSRICKSDNEENTCIKETQTVTKQENCND